MLDGWRTTEDRLATGAGSASRHSIGTGVIGGMLAATFLAILFVPLFYRLVARERKQGTDVVADTASGETPGRA